MKKILAEISVGELVDKLTILEIKLKKITQTLSLKKIRKEFESLKQIKLENIDTDQYQKLYDELMLVNSKLWNIENEKRLCEKNSDFGEKFVKISRDIHFMNDKRAKIKLKINQTFKSNIEEVKEYTKY
tara:strand:+ start:358 stop:744 length:387 start_codon:yes stop_codon:yes gene_type:complete